MVRIDFSGHVETRGPVPALLRYVWYADIAGSPVSYDPLADIRRVTHWRGTALDGP
jgi:hypothetical protein